MTQNEDIIKKRSLMLAIKEIERVGSLLKLPKPVTDEAAIIFRNATEKGILKGRSVESVVAASIYIACRKLRVPVTFDEIMSYFTVTDGELKGAYKAIIMGLDIKVPLNDAEELLVKIGEKLNLSEITINKAREIIEKVKNSDYTIGKDPSGLAAASIYIAGLLTGEHKLQKEIAPVAGVTEVTLRTRYKEIMKLLNIKIPQEDSTQQKNDNSGNV